MTKHAILNNAEHRDLRVQTGHSAAYGDAMMCTLAIPSEFRNLQADYPIFLHQDSASGKFMPMVMLRSQR